MNFYTYARHYGNDILFRGVKDGKRFTARRGFQPTLFVKSQEKSKYKSIFGENVSPMKFPTNKEATAFFDSYKDVDNFPIFGQNYYAYQYITENYPGEIQWDANKMAIYSIDIETTSEGGFPNVDSPSEKVLVITLQNNNTKKITTFGLGEFTPTKETSHLDIDYHGFDTEEQLLENFLTWWQENCPDIITGWNSNLFDMPYLITRVQRVLGEDEHKRFSPFKLINKRPIRFANREMTAFEITGVAQLDYLDLYKKFTYVTRESYKLDFIAETELGKNKLESGFDTFKEFYDGDWNRFVEYNIIDTVIVDELEDKMKLIELAITMAYDAKCNYNDVFSAVRTWDSLLYNHLWEKDIVIHQGGGRKDRQIEGAFVQEPVPGSYEWVASFDATSLYPSILMQHNMSPETIVPGFKYDVSVDDQLDRYQLDKLKEKNYTMAGNGSCYTREKKGLFPEIVQKFFNDRLKYKKLMQKAQKDFQETGALHHKNEISKYNNFQMARKIQLNSLYGALANQYFRFYDDRIAEGITMSGQLVIRDTAKALDKYMNKVCGTEDEMYSFYSDTDSCYVTCKNLVDNFFPDKDVDKVVGLLDKIGTEKIEPAIAQAMTKLGNYTNAFEHKIDFKREVIADKGVFVAKKRYALNVLDDEGLRLKDPKLKVMGLEIVRSSTPAPIRDSLKEAVRLILTSDEEHLQKYIAEAQKHFNTLTAEDIAFPRGCNNLKKYTSTADVYQKGTPIHVRGSLLYNKLLKDKSLNLKYENIQEGDKIKFLYLKEPNSLHENTIAFVTKLPKEFEITKYVDYDLIFQKAFIDPLENILKPIGWNTEPQATLEDLFR
jgi:DNA polymerase elongation subunit (family B)|tara:strand:- start:9525 stop:12020 length:2496 start_codon:yes stop_codon:yes gene_type:complete